jgi:hypothetical protein
MTRYLITTSWILIIIAALLAVWLVPDALAGALVVGVRVVVYAISAAVVVVVLYGAWSGLERIMMLRAQRKEKEHDAYVKMLTAPGDHQVWAHEMGFGYRNLTLDSRVLVDNSRRAPTDEERRAWGYRQQMLQPRARVVGKEAPALMAPEAAPDLLSMLPQLPVCIVVGSMNAGKTALLHWIAEQYQGRAHVLVLDPHSGPDAWPGARVVGTGRNFEEISEALDGLVRLMTKRYEEIGAGMVREGSHTPVVVIADEWTSINTNCANADKMMVSLLTESRKAALKVYVGSHSRRVKSLGVDRRGDLLDGVAFVLLRNDNGRRWAEVETNDGENAHRTVAALPGEYRVIDDDPAEDVLAAALEPPPLEPGGEDARVIEMYLSGASLREITTAVWDKHGAFYNEKVEQILRRYKVNEFLGEK